MTMNEYESMIAKKNSRVNVETKIILCRPIDFETSR